MAEKQKLSNSFTIIGTLKGVEFKNKDKLAEYVSAIATIDSNIGGVTNNFSVEFFAKAVTNDGKPSKLYSSYKDMEKNIGKRIKVDGELRENRYYNAQRETIVGSNVLSGKFVNFNPTDDDVAKFEFAGFIATELKEKTNKDGEVYSYTIGIGQEGYKENTLNVIQFNIEASPECSNIVSYVRDNYLTGTSVLVTGELDSHVEKTAVTVNEGGFGGPIVREYSSVRKNFFITQGSAPILADKAYYDDNKIAAMVQNYKAHDVEIEKAAKDRAEGIATPAASPAAPTTKKRTGSLI